MLSALLDCSIGTYASKIEIENDSFVVTKGNRWRSANNKAAKPAVLTTDLRLNEPRYASLPNIMKAKQKTIDEVDPADLQIEMQPKVVTKK